MFGKGGAGGLVTDAWVFADPWLERYNVSKEEKMKNDTRPPRRRPPPNPLPLG